MSDLITNLPHIFKTLFIEHTCLLNVNSIECHSDYHQILKYKQSETSRLMFLPLVIVNVTKYWNILPLLFHVLIPDCHQCEPQCKSPKAADMSQALLQKHLKNLLCYFTLTFLKDLNQLDSNLFDLTWNWKANWQSDGPKHRDLEKMEG